jgi:hypothetical protein
MDVWRMVFFNILEEHSDQQAVKEGDRWHGLVCAWFYLTRVAVEGERRWRGGLSAARRRKCRGKVGISRGLSSCFSNPAGCGGKKTEF